MSFVRVNEIRSHNPLVDPLNIEASSVTINGTPISGGSAYPENVLILTTGTYNLTLNDQGIVFLAGGSPILPSTAPDGTTYKFFGAANDMDIDTNGSTIASYGSGTIRIGRIPLIIKALNVPGLIWIVENRTSIPHWYANAVYASGDLVEVSGVWYKSKIDSNFNNNPASTNSWERVLQTTAHTDTIPTGEIGF